MPVSIWNALAGSLACDVEECPIDGWIPDEDGAMFCSVHMVEVYGPAHDRGACRDISTCSTCLVAGLYWPNGNRNQAGEEMWS